MKIKDDKIDTITNDIERIQAKPTMYISFTGHRAYEHLVHELLNNVIDENINPNTISDGTCNMLYDQEENMFYIEDSGRGVPFESLEDICTILHSGSKMVRASGTSSGENGVGLTATNALSDTFEITSMRNGKMRMLQFKNGQKTMDVTQDIEDANKHGLLVAFRPSPILLGKDCVMPVDSVKLWLTKTSFFMPKNMKVKFTVEYTGKQASSATVYTNTEGIGGFLAKVVPEANLLKTPIVLTNSYSIQEEVPMQIQRGDNEWDIETVVKDRTIGLQVAINMNQENPTELVRYSFCNTLENIEHGEHSAAAMNAIVSFFKKKMKENSTKKNLDVTSNDITNGLAFVVNMETDLSVGLFTGQTKHKMDNKIVYEPIRKMTLDALEEYFKLPENKKVLTAVLGFIRENISARLAATQSRKRTTKKQSFMYTTLISGYRAPNKIGEPGIPFELYIVEGDSAGGNAAIARYDNNVQGTLALTGKPSNVYDETLSSVSAKDKFPEFKKLMDEILGCGYGPNFNLDNLVYDKIIISTDADIDGSHIAGLLVAMIYKWARPLIEHGHVYRVITPLYRLVSTKKAKNSKNEIDRDAYIYSKDEYFGKYAEIVSNKITLKSEDKFFTKKEMTKFLQTNRDYYTLLISIASHYTLHPDIIEFIAANISDFREKITEEFPEITYDKENDSILGVYEEEYYTIILDKVFLSRVQELTAIIVEGNHKKSRFDVYKKIRGEEPEFLGNMCIGQIMNACAKYEPAIQSRYKGLGELDADEFYHLAMDPTKRKLIRLTVSDVERMTEIMDDLFLDSRRGVRKELVANSNISIDDIDN